MQLKKPFFQSTRIVSLKFESAYLFGPTKIGVLFESREKQSAAMLRNPIFSSIRVFYAKIWSRSFYENEKREFLDKESTRI
jgi:hypothetical protein